jgi:hypothetical protein
MEEKLEQRVKVSNPNWEIEGTLGEFIAIRLRDDSTDSFPCSECGKGIIYHDDVCYIVDDWKTYTIEDEQKGDVQILGCNDAYCTLCYSKFPADKKEMYKVALTQH